MTRWRCVCAYDGGGFSGWQSQPRRDSVQDAIEARLAEIAGRDVRIHGSGRTDAGVHALGQVFHFDAEWRHGAERLAAAMAHGLPRTIQIVSARRAPASFHARFSATGKVYRYRLFRGDPDPFMRPYCWALPQGLDSAAMAAAAGVLVGRHDFGAFSALNGDENEGEADTVRELRRLVIGSRGRMLTVEAEADGFLYKMIRSLVGALVSAGQGKLGQSELSGLLASGVRTPRIQTAPPQGLYLYKVLYRRTKNSVAT
jgi:tRNA pseudouridine38-40 synthase